MIALLFLIILVMYLLPTYPKPIIIENFLSEEERTHIMTEAKSKLQVSTVAKDRKVDESIRKSETAWLSLDDPVVRGVVERCVSRTDRQGQSVGKIIGAVGKYCVGLVVVKAAALDCARRYGDIDEVETRLVVIKEPEHRGQAAFVAAEPELQKALPSRDSRSST